MPAGLNLLTCLSSLIITLPIYYKIPTRLWLQCKGFMLVHLHLQNRFWIPQYQKSSHWLVLSRCCHSNRRLEVMTENSRGQPDFLSSILWEWSEWSFWLVIWINLISKKKTILTPATNRKNHQWPKLIQ